VSECVDVYVIDNACTKIVHHFREAHHQMKLGEEDEMGEGWAGRKARYNSTTEGRRLTRDGREWEEIIANSIPDIKEEHESVKEKG